MAQRMDLVFVSSVVRVVHQVGQERDSSDDCDNDNDNCHRRAERK